MRIAVIGAGLGGLALALRLQGAGCEVTVLEQRGVPGGRIGRLTDAGYTWDTAASLITMPWLLEETFAAGGIDLHSEVTLRRLDPLYRLRWASDPRTFDFVDSAEGLREEVAKFSVRDAQRVGDFLDAAGRIYAHAMLDVGRRPHADLRSPAAQRPPLPRPDARMPLHRFVSHFFHHPRVREAFSFHSLFVGSDPFRMPAIYASLVYLQVLDGGWYADGGVFSLIEPIARRVDLRCGARVVAVETAGGRVRGVRLEDGERLAADAVVSNADVLRTDELLGRPASGRARRATLSCLQLHLGLDRRFEALAHHTLLIGPDYRDFVQSVTQGRRAPHTFCAYAHAPARRQPAMAPPGADALTFLLPVPDLRAGFDWEREADGLRAAFVGELERSFGLVGLDAAVVVEHRMTPPDFVRELGAVDGNAFSLEPTLLQSPISRPPNRVPGVAGMYQVGAGTHPGAGIPGVLTGAALTAQLVLDDAHRRG